MLIRAENILSHVKYFEGLNACKNTKFPSQCPSETPLASNKGVSM